MIVGIDLGTTNSLVACFIDGSPLIIPNVHGEQLTPSVVSVGEDGEIFVGNIAKERLVTHPSLTAEIFKRSMGSKKQYNLGEHTFSPEELSSFVIKKLIEDAQIYLSENHGKTISEAVISVPAYFNDTQRRATKAAGELAGIKVERIVNEPTSASLAYGFNDSREFAKLLIFDLGGGTFDVSVLEKYNNVMEVRAVAGDIFLGGEDFTDILEKLFIKKAAPSPHEIPKENGDGDEEKADEVSSPQVKQRSLVESLSLKETNRAILRKSIEDAKRAFSGQKTVKIQCNFDDSSYEADISVGEFESSCDDLLSRLRVPIKNAISDAGVSLKDIDNIILVGGATKLHVVKKFVSRLFGRIPLSHINPDEVVALGTAIHAALKERNESISEVVLTDVCPFTLGMESSRKLPNGLYYNNLYTPIIERNTIIPASRVERFYTLHDNQSSIFCRILQGESHKASENVQIGELTVEIPNAPAGQESADVRFTYDINGILEVEVTVVSSGIKKTIVIEKNPGVFTSEEVEQKIKELSSYKIHPREQEVNRLLISRAERLYQESLGELRNIIGRELTNFYAVLDSQDNKRIRDHSEKFREFIEEIENDRSGNL